MEMDWPSTFRADCASTMPSLCVKRFRSEQADMVDVAVRMMQAARETCPSARLSLPFTKTAFSARSFDGIGFNFASDKPV